jgi:histidinol phosphatase-like PHP family hydrolase
MIQDLHSHTYYSACAYDKPEKVIEAAINGGIQMLGICDHSYGVGHYRASDFSRTYARYHDHINLLKEKYRNKIKILSGIEIRTAFQNPNYTFPENADVSFFDYCLIENLDDPLSITKGDIFSFAKRCGCTTGIAHTDMFKFIKSLGEDPYRYFRKMAERGIFWEMNVNYDSVHNFKTHDYVSTFLQSKEQQEIVKKSGVRLSVGFDCHKADEYKAMRIITACKIIQDAGIHLIFEGK